MTESGKMKKPRAKAAKKQVRHENTAVDPNQIGVPWGRAASEYRPGLFIKHYFEEHGEACAADIYYALSQEIKRMNEERVEIGEKAFRRPNYSSFAKYFHWFKLLDLIEPTGKTEAAIYDFLEKKQFYRLTDKGVTEELAWQDPVRAAHPEFG
jgi:hypothetical protein